MRPVHNGRSLLLSQALTPPTPRRSPELILILIETACRLLSKEMSWRNPA